MTGLALPLEDDDRQAIPVPVVMNFKFEPDAWLPSSESLRHRAW